MKRYKWLNKDSRDFLKRGYLREGESAEQRGHDIAVTAEKLLKIKGFSDKFEDYLHKQKVNLPRVDLVIKCQRILKAKKNHGKFGTKSCVSWRILDQEIDKDDLKHENIVVDKSAI